MNRFGFGRLSVAISCFAISTIQAQFIIPGSNTPTLLTTPMAVVNPTITTGYIADPPAYLKWLDKHLFISPMSCLQFNSYFCDPNLIQTRIVPSSLANLELDVDGFYPDGTNWAETDRYFGDWASNLDRDGQVVVGDFDGNGTDDFLLFAGPDWNFYQVAYSDAVADPATIPIHSVYSVKNFSLTNYTAIGKWKKICVGDFDGDGRKDIAMLGYSESRADLIFLFAKPNQGGFEPRYFTHNVNGVVLPGQGTGYLNNFSGRALTSIVKAGDFDGDGIDDVFISGFDNGKGYGVVFMKGRFTNSGGSTGLNYSDITVNKPVIQFWDYPTAQQAKMMSANKYNYELHDIGFGRFNRDNKMDFTLRFYNSDHTYTFLSNGTSGFQLVDDAPTNGSLLAAIANPAYVHYNEFDGFLSTVAADYGYRQTPNPTFCSDLLSRKGVDGYVDCNSMLVKRPGGRLVTGDFNGDGLEDFALIDQASRYEEENGDLNGTPIDERRYPRFPLFPVAFSKGDGRFDVVQMDAPGNRQLADYASRMAKYDKVWVEEYDKKDENGNTITVSEQRSTSDLNLGTEIVVGDFNADGMDDIALRNLPSSETVWRGGSNYFQAIPIALSGGDGSFTFYTRPDANAQGVAGQCRNPYAMIKVGDFNGDGRTDIAVIRKERDRNASPYVPIAYSNWPKGKRPVPAPIRGALSAITQLLLQ